MQIITDLQLHSKYARAVSQQMVVSHIWEWAKTKGIGLIATGDWTHPLWLREIKNDLEEIGNGLLRIKNPASPAGGHESRVMNNGDGPLFLLETEVSCIYSQGGKLRRIHILIWSPSIDTCEKINQKLTSMGANLMSDGRPIMGLTSKQIVEVILAIDPKCLIVPAHIWTPWFSLYGSESGFDSISDCFGDFAKDIFAVETGLSSNPEMNWRIKELDTRSIVSFSDAHSGPKLGREATVFELSELSFENISMAIKAPSFGKDEVKKNKILYSIEFYPEEGKYHYTGHRNCNIKQTPEETRRGGTQCSVCGRKLTVGVMHRVDQLAGRGENELRMGIKNFDNLKANFHYSRAFPNRPSYTMFVPLQEILAEVVGASPASKSVQNEYKKLIDNFNSEFDVLLKVDSQEIKKISGEKTADAIDRVRTGKIFVNPGYDGVFGKVEIWHDQKSIDKAFEKKQMSMF